MQHLEPWPPGEYETTVTPDGRLILKVPRMVRREFIRVMMFDARNDTFLPDVLYVKWDEGEAKLYAMGPQRIFPRWFNEGIRVIFVVGLIATVYVALRAIQTLAG